MGSDKEMGISVKVHRFQQICCIVTRSLFGIDRKETLLKFCKIMKIPTLLYESEC
jgi:hypothetical protein